MIVKLKGSICCRLSPLCCAVAGRASPSTPACPPVDSGSPTPPTSPAPPPTPGTSSRAGPGLNSNAPHHPLLFIARAKMFSIGRPVAEPLSQRSVRPLRQSFKLLEKSDRSQRAINRTRCGVSPGRRERARPSQAAAAAPEHRGSQSLSREGAHSCPCLLSVCVCV